MKRMDKESNNETKLRGKHDAGATTGKQSSYFTHMRTYLLESPRSLANLVVDEPIERLRSGGRVRISISTLGHQPVLGDHIQEHGVLTAVDLGGVEDVGPQTITRLSWRGGINEQKRRGIRNAWLHTKYQFFKHSTYQDQS